MQKFLTWILVGFFLIFFATSPSLAKKHSKKQVKKQRTSKKTSISEKRVREPKTVVEKLVAKMVKTMGGRKNLLSVRSTYSIGHTKIITALGEQSGKIISYFLKPAQQRTEIQIGHTTIIQTINKLGGWMQQGTSIISLPRSMIEMSNAELAHLDLEIRFLTEDIKVRQLGQRRIRGKECSVVSFTDKKKRKTLYYISQKNHRLIKSSYLAPSPLGQKKTRYSTYASKYRWVYFPNKKDKILIPFFIEKFMGGRKVGSISLKKVFINSPKVTKQLFKIPSPVD